MELGGSLPHPQQSTTCPILLTYSMVQSSFSEANWLAASQETPRISRNPMVHYRTHKRPPPVSILGQPNPVHIPTSHLLEILPNIVHPSTPRSPQWSPSLPPPVPTLATSVHSSAHHTFDRRSLFPSWSGRGLISTPIQRDKDSNREVFYLTMLPVAKIIYR